MASQVLSLLGGPCIFPPPFLAYGLSVPRVFPGRLRGHAVQSEISPVLGAALPSLRGESAGCSPGRSAGWQRVRGVPHLSRGRWQGGDRPQSLWDLSGPSHSLTFNVLGGLIHAPGTDRQDPGVPIGTSEHLSSCQLSASRAATGRAAHPKYLLLPPPAPGCSLGCFHSGQSCGHGAWVAAGSRDALI